VDRLNMLIPDRDRWLKVPELKFNRKIGMYGHQTWTIEGSEISQEKYAEYLANVLPQPADYLRLRELMKDNDWIAPKKQGDLDTA
jgi:hypothetical protein